MDVLGEVNKKIEQWYEENCGEPTVIRDVDGTKHYQFPKRYAVYTLENQPIDHNAHESGEYLAEEWRKFATEFDYLDPHNVPSWAWAAYYSDEVYYVGMTSNIYERIQDHVWEIDEKTSIFNCIFPPVYINSIEWVNTEAQALQREEERAAEVEKQYRDAFVYQA